MNEKWIIAIIIIAVLYVVLDFIKDGFKENAISNGMNEKEAREHYKWKNLLHRKKKTLSQAEMDSVTIPVETSEKEYIEVESVEEEIDNESGEDESMPEMSKHLYW